jgi:hypothetical protein
MWQLGYPREVHRKFTAFALCDLNLSAAGVPFHRIDKIVGYPLPVCRTQFHVSRILKSINQ